MCGEEDKGTKRKDKEARKKNRWDAIGGHIDAQ